ncbi:MAG: patatin-like phospholipase family protein [Chloroflexota bacterium]
MAHENPKVGFALSGGGSRAACEVGMLRALDEAGIHADVLAGTSAGAVIGIWQALFPDRIDRLESIWLSLRTQDVFPGNRLQLLANFVRHGHVHAARSWERFLRRHFEDARFEDLSMPCGVVAVELTTGAVHVFDSGEIVPAVMASTAIPGVFPPVAIEDRMYVDGGLLEYLPVTPLLAHDVDVVYGLDCSYLEPHVGRGWAVMDRCDRISARADADAALGRVSQSDIEMQLLRPPLPDVADPRSFAQSAALIRAGYDYVASYLAGRQRSEYQSALA